LKTEEHKRLYVSDTGTSPGVIKIWNLADGKKLQNGRAFVAMTMKGQYPGWSLGGEGFDGVHVFAPDG
jgi:hypothetical protein